VNKRSSVGTKFNTRVFGLFLSQLASEILTDTMRFFIPYCLRSISFLQTSDQPKIVYSKGVLAVDVTCLYGTSRSHGIGNYAKWLLCNLRKEDSTLLFFLQSSRGVELLRQSSNETEVLEFESIVFYDNLEILVRENNVCKVLFLSPFEESVSSLVVKGVSTYVVLYDLIPLYRPWQFQNFSSLKTYLKKLNQLRFSYVFTISSQSKSEFLKINPGHRRIFSLPAPTDDPLQIVSNSRKREPKLDNTFIVFTGKDPRKNIARVILAWTKSQLPASFQLYVVGEIPQQLARLSREESHQNIFFLGTLSDIEKSHLFSRSHYLICPSTDEGLGLPIIESVQASMTAIYSDIPSHKSLIQSGGVPFNPRSVNNLKGIFIKILSGAEFSPIRLQSANENLSDIFRVAKLFQ